MTLKFIFLVITTFSINAWSYLTLNETAEILPENYYVIGIAPQVILSEGEFNLGAFVDMHLFDDIDGRCDSAERTASVQGRYRAQALVHPAVPNPSTFRSLAGPEYQRPCGEVCRFAARITSPKPCKRWAITLNTKYLRNHMIFHTLNPTAP